MPAHRLPLIFSILTAHCPCLCPLRLSMRLPCPQNEWNAWVCPWRQGQEVGRVELRIPGFTKAWDTGGWGWGCLRLVGGACAVLCYAVLLPSPA